MSVPRRRGNGRGRQTAVAMLFEEAHDGLVAGLESGTADLLVIAEEPGGKAFRPRPVEQELQDERVGVAAEATREDEPVHMRRQHFDKRVEHPVGLVEGPWSLRARREVLRP